MSVNTDKTSIASSMAERTRKVVEQIETEMQQLFCKKASLEELQEQSAVVSIKDKLKVISDELAYRGNVIKFLQGTLTSLEEALSQRNDLWRYIK